MDEIRGTFREIGLENRIEILTFLEQRPRSLLEIKKHLKSLGSNKPHTTVARYIEGLVALNLIREEGVQFTLTAWGCLLLQYCEDSRRNFRVLKSIERYPGMETLCLLPKEFLKELWVLEEAEVTEDIYTGLARAIKAANEAREKLLILAWVAEKEATEINISRALKGVKVLGVVETSTIPIRMEIKRKLEIPLRLNSPEVRAKLSKKFQIKKYKHLPLQLIVSDSGKAGIQLINPSTQSLSPYFISDKKEFVRWTEKIFYHYWERSEPVVIY